MKSNQITSGSNSADPLSIPSTENSRLKISLYENVANWLIAFLMLSSVITGCLLLIWFGSRMRYERKTYVMKVTKGDGSGRGRHAPGIGLDAKRPGDPDLPILDEPAGSEVLQLTQVEPINGTQFFADAAILAVAEVGDIPFDSVATRASGLGLRGTSGGDEGFGDRRPAGPLGDGPATIPREERWEFQFASNSRKTYAQQLDFFRIELGVLGGKKEIDYAYNVSKSKPDTKTGPSKTENRLYMTWKNGTLRELDRSILADVGIETTGRLTVQFFPKEVEDALYDLEVMNAGNRTPKEFLKTTFGVRPAGAGFEFFVIEQRFRPAAR